jgi:4-hydroxy-3-methylbut-2-enyl diphosphate reductase
MGGVHVEVLVAKIGLCFGIHRAYQNMDNLAAQGNLIRVGSGKQKNTEWDVLQRIKNRDADLFRKYPNLEGLEIVQDTGTLTEGVEVAIGYHGYEPELMSDLESRGVILHNYQCPFIAKMNEIAEELAAEGYDLIAFGKSQNHHCLYAKRVAERFGRACLITEDVVTVKETVLEPGRKWACIGQVTGDAGRWDDFVQGLNAMDIPVRVVDTVCSDSRDRQSEAAALASEADVVIVVDDGGDASTSVYDTCHRTNSRTFRYGTGMPLREAWIKGATRIAVVGGIMVPDWVLDRVAKEVLKFGETPSQ